MEWFYRLFLCLINMHNVASYYDNYTIDAASRQLQDFKAEHSNSIGLLTTSDGGPVEIRDTNTLNTDVFGRRFHIEQTMHANEERIPERVVHAKGTGAFGYFEVTHDVSKYTKADVFNGIGKKTQLVARFSTTIENIGGAESGRETKGLAIKLYTEEGNLDILTLQVPVFFYTDPVIFSSFVRAFRRNPRTNIFDFNTVWDFVTMRPQLLHAFLWLQTDIGIPNGYRKMDVFPLHTYEIYNQNSDRYYVRFNFRTEQGLENLTSTEAMAISALDPDYYTRDLYNAISEKNYPSWKLEMDVLTLDDIKKVNYNPFDLTRSWKRGTYHTVQIGRMVLDRNVDNNFRDSEQAAYNPDNLVPGITGPVDVMFKGRKISYLDTQNYRLGVNHNKIEVNSPRYEKTYNRDGVPPVADNMKDAPSYYPNTFNGPAPYVDESRPRETLIVLESNAVDLEPANELYNNVLEDDAHRQRMADNLAASLETVVPSVLKRALKLLILTDVGLGRRVRASVKALRTISKNKSNNSYKQIAQCMAMSLNRYGN